VGDVCVLVRWIRGVFSNVVGLSLCGTMYMCRCVAF